MDGAAGASQLIVRNPAPAGGGVRFEAARPRHDAALRRLLRENPMPGWIRLSLEREPGYFAAAAIEGPEHRAIVAIEDDRVICAGGVSARRRFVNGAAMPVGYLGGLRMDASCRGRASVIRHGFDLFRRLRRQGGPPIYLTSILADNRPARRLLERGLKGMPTYRFLGDFVTLIIRRRSRWDVADPARLASRRLRTCGLRLPCGSDAPIADIVELVNRDHRRYQFAPVWSAEELNAGDFRVVRGEDDAPAACAALRDDRAIRQAVVRGYAQPLRAFRPLINLGAWVLGRPGLPRIGESVPHAFVSHLVADPLQPRIAEALILLLQGAARARRIDHLTIGFDARDPRLAHLRRTFRPREVVSRLYVVHWEDGEELAQTLDDRLLAPEVALL